MPWTYPFNLTLINGGVDALANIVHDINAFEPPLTRHRIDLNL